MMQVVENFVDNKNFTGDVLVAEGDDIVLESAYGYADLDWSIPFTLKSLLILVLCVNICLQDSKKN